MNTKEIVVSVFSVAIKIVIAIVVVMFIYKYAVLAYDYGYRIFGEEPMSTGEGRIVSVTIGSDLSTKEIGQALENKGLIRDANLFVLQEKLSENSGKITAGIYDLSTSMTAEEMISVMSGDIVDIEATTVQAASAETDESEMFEAAPLEQQPVEDTESVTGEE